MKNKYQFLEHTADTKFLAYGKTLEEAFANAAIATTAVMTDVTKIKVKIEKKINIKSTKKESLLYDFFDNIIFLLDTEGFLVCDVKEIKIKKTNNNYILTATLVGDNAENYDVHTYIKAPTYNDMFIKEEQNKVTIQAVHDI